MSIVTFVRFFDKKNGAQDGFLSKAGGCFFCESTIILLPIVRSARRPVRRRTFERENRRFSFDGRSAKKKRFGRRFQNNVKTRRRVGRPFERGSKREAVFGGVAGSRRLARRDDGGSRRNVRKGLVMNAKNQPISKPKNADAYFAPTVRPLRVGAAPARRVELPDGARFSVATAEAERFFVLEKLLTTK